MRPTTAQVAAYADRSATRTERAKQINHKLCTHAATPYGRRQCRNHARSLPTLANLVDTAQADVLKANMAQPYNHNEYERCSRVLDAALVVFANGDVDYANALRNHLLDSGEEVMYYVERFDRETIMEWVGRYV